MTTEIRDEIARLAAIVKAVSIPQTIIDRAAAATRAGEEVARIGEIIRAKREELSKQPGSTIEQVSMKVEQFSKQFEGQRADAQAIRNAWRRDREAMIAEHAPAYYAKLSAAERDAAALMHDLLDLLEQAAAPFAEANRKVAYHAIPPTTVMRAGLYLTGLVQSAREGLGPR